MGGEEEENPNPIYIVADVVEEILVRLPIKSIIRFKAVSREWRSTLESSRFADRRRMRVPKKRKILAVGGNRTQSRFKGDAEIETVYLECDEATLPSLTCNGVVCIPEPNWISSEFNINSAMGFGKDEVNGKYKVVRMSFEHNSYQILDVDIGQWRELVPPPFEVETSKKSACVKGSIYWLDFFLKYKILALDLHTEEFRDVHVLPPPMHTGQAQIVNLDDRLAIADFCVFKPGWNLEIWIMDDAQEETWTMTYCITLAHRVISLHGSPSEVLEEWSTMFTPLTVSKEGSLFFSDSKKRLCKYDPDTDSLCCLSSDICVISPFVENLVRLQSGCVPKTRPPRCRPRYRSSCLNQVPGSRISNIVRRIKLLIPNILLTSTLVSLICFGYSYRYPT
ncbi:hypothetical protein N665_0323s0037 [Sinapis alba]|nr:hypothetical protein N665_0323s0037 [Sinapis alba]